MGKLKSHIQEWLETYGYDLGYGMDNLPPLDQMDEFTPPADGEPSDKELAVIENEYSNEELSELEWLENNNPDDGSWDGR